MKAAKKSRPTLCLAMIMKDEIDDLERIIHECGEYFDKIYITATNKKLHTALRKKIANKHPAYKKVELSYFKWIDHFGKARLYNHSQIKTDYWMCIDPDDEIEGAENLQKVIEYMIAKNLDAALFQYETARRMSLLEPVSIGWRERVIRTASGLKWSDKAIHENIYIEGDTYIMVTDVIVRHRKTAEQMVVSGERNRLILEKEWQRTPRSSTAWYMGKYLTRMGDYEGAIEKFLFVTEHSKIKPEQFRAWQGLGDCYFQIGNYEASLDAANKGNAIYPDHPGPWYDRFAVYAAMRDFDTALQSAEIAMGKRIEGEMVLYSHDSSKYQYRGPFAVAEAYLSIGNVERAYELYQQVKKTAPEYIDELSKATGVQWDAVFEQPHQDKLATG